ncbi:MAG: nucleotide exchange factor GrpE [Succinivibrionaceae bacterium]|nr:nucleotide exchange factor GrpE [Succinivibrionaceae bacterium]
MQTEEEKVQAAVEALKRAAPEGTGPVEAAQEGAEGEDEAVAGDAQAELLAEIASLTARLEKSEAQAAAERERLLRAVADAENSRRIAEQDVAKERKFGIERLVKALLPVVDSLDLALEHTDRNNPATKATVEGIEGTLTLFLKELGSFGVERIDPKGAPFDPNLHQAITMIPTAEVEPNHVVSVMQKGFVLNGRVVRPAMVAVSAKLPDPVPPKMATDTEEKPSQINIEA